MNDCTCGHLVEHLGEHCMNCPHHPIRMETKVMNDRCKCGTIHGSSPVEWESDPLQEKVKKLEAEVNDWMAKFEGADFGWSAMTEEVKKLEQKKEVIKAAINIKMEELVNQLSTCRCYDPPRPWEKHIFEYGPLDHARHSSAEDACHVRIDWYNMLKFLYERL